MQFAQQRKGTNHNSASSNFTTDARFYPTSLSPGDFLDSHFFMQNSGWFFDKCGWVDGDDLQSGRRCFLNGWDEHASLLRWDSMD